MKEPHWHGAVSALQMEAFRDDEKNPKCMLKWDGLVDIMVLHGLHLDAGVVMESLPVMKSWLYGF